MSLTIPAVTIAIPQSILILLLICYVVVSIFIVLLITVASEVPFMGSGWKKNIIWYILFFPGTMVCFVIWAIIVGFLGTLDFLLKSRILK
jgi:hypothetical protein